MGTTPPGNSRLELLPRELLDIVFEVLDPSRAKPIFTWFTTDYCRRGTLRSMCLVSKAMDAMSRPALYEHVLLYRPETVVRLYATFDRKPLLAGYVRSLRFENMDSGRFDQEQACTIDLTPLRSCQDSVYAFWTRDQSTTKTHMPQQSRDELVYILFSKILSQTSALQSLDLTLPRRSPREVIPDFYDHLQIDDLHMVQLQQISERFQVFCQGHSFLDLPKLKTLALLQHDYLDDVQSPIALSQKLLSLPCLQNVVCFKFRRFYLDAHLRICHGSSAGLGVDNAWFSAGVKNVEFRKVTLMMRDIPSLTAAFPSLESLVLDRCTFHGASKTLQEGHPLFRQLGERLHTLVLEDMDRKWFTTEIMTASEPYRLFNLAALTGLRNLVVPVDFFFNLECREDDGMRRTRFPGVTVILPASLRCITLVFDAEIDWEWDLLADEYDDQWDADLWWRQNRDWEFLQENAPTLLNTFPQLEKIDLCYCTLDYYRQQDVETLASRR